MRTVGNDKINYALNEMETLMREVRSKSKSLEEGVDAIENPERAAVRENVREQNDTHTRLEVKT